MHYPSNREADEWAKYHCIKREGAHEDEAKSGDLEYSQIIGSLSNQTDKTSGVRWSE